MNNHFDSIDAALADLRLGKLIIVLDDHDREYEGDLIGAASLATPQTINFMVKHARGAFIAVFTPAGWCDKLGIGAMAPKNNSFNHTQFRVAVDGRNGGSGSSAADRALTVNLLGGSSTTLKDFVQPGHVIPIEAHPAGLAARRGHTEAGVALMKLAGFTPPVAVDLEILDDNGEMARESALFSLARRFDLKIITLDSIAIRCMDIAEASTMASKLPSTCLVDRM